MKFYPFVFMLFESLLILKNLFMGLLTKSSEEYIDRSNTSSSSENESAEDSKRSNTSSSSEHGSAEDSCRSNTASSSEHVSDEDDEIRNAHGSRNCKITPDETRVLLAKCKKDSELQNCTTFSITDGITKKIGYQVLYDSVKNIIDTSETKFYITTVVNFNDHKEHKSSFYKQHLGIAYASYKAQGIIVHSIGNLGIFSLARVKMYPDYADAIHGGFKELVSFYEFANKALLDNMIEIAYDLLRTRLILELKKDYEQAFFAKKDPEESATLAMEKTAKLISSYELNHKDYRKLESFHASGLRKFRNSIEIYQNSFDCNHFDWTIYDDYLLEIVKNLTSVVYKNQFMSFIEEIVSRFASILNTPANIDIIKKVYVSGLEKLVQYFSSVTRTLDSFDIERYFQNYNYVNFYNIFRPYFDEMLLSLVADFQVEKDMLCQKFKIRNITRIVISDLEVLSKYQKALRKIIGGDDIPEDSAADQSRTTNEKTVAGNEDMSKNIASETINFPEVAGTRYVCSYTNKVGDMEGKPVENESENASANPIAEN